MTIIDIPDEIKIKNIQRIFSRQQIQGGERGGMIDLGLDAVVNPEEAAILSFFLSHEPFDIEEELIIRKKNERHQ